ncbi:hypothetical protein T492DRAFT_1105290 [Pavlovales sp. CCMP2436]|nr:hypothetical protein T492DRAFT_1105290 [Pavlovales sp. CCMP2436]
MAAAFAFVVVFYYKFLALRCVIFFLVHLAPCPPPFPIFACLCVLCFAFCTRRYPARYHRIKSPHAMMKPSL